MDRSQLDAAAGLDEDTAVLELDAIPQPLRHGQQSRGEFTYYSDLG